MFFRWLVSLRGVDGLRWSISLRGVGGLLQVYNLGTGHGYSVLDMVKAFEKASGKKVS